MMIRSLHLPWGTIAQGRCFAETAVVASRRNAGEAVQSLAAQCNADGDGNERGETEQRNQENRGADYAEAAVSLGQGLNCHAFFAAFSPAKIFKSETDVGFGPR